MPQPRDIPRDDRLVDAALLPDSIKTAIRRALAKRRAAENSPGFNASQEGIDHFDATDLSLIVGDAEAVVCLGVGKPSGLFRRRAKTYWIFVGQREGEHFFPISSHATKDSAADMLIALHMELAELKP